MTALAIETPAPLPCTGGRYPIYAAGAYRRTCCASHWWSIHPGWNPPVLDDAEPDAN